MTGSYLLHNKVHNNGLMTDWGYLYLLFSYVCVRARAFQQRCCFFAVTSVTRREKNGQKNSRKFSETQEIKRYFRYLLPRTNPTRITSLLTFI